MIYDSRKDTEEHMQQVYGLLLKIVEELATRAAKHDLSKLVDPEKAAFDKFTPLLKGSTYGSREYEGFLSNMEPALDHHYRNNRHHPEHFKKYQCIACKQRFDMEVISCPNCACNMFTIHETGIKGMNIVDIVEMLCDWKAASMRHADGNIFASINFNQKRFKYSDELASIFRNTAKELF